MILTQKNLSNAWEQFKWPLNGIRRYGYYKDIFLFESGRKCPHGEGLYAFKCSKAKYLNEALHKAITNNASSVPDESNGNATKRVINTKLSRFVIKEESEQITHSDSSIDTAELNVNAANALKQSPSLESSKSSSTQMFTSAPQTPTVSQTMSTALLEDESTSPTHTNKSTSQHNYVNANSLISLPPLISLSFLNAPSTVTMEDGINRDYINAPYFSQLQQRHAEKQEIDPTLLSLALKINGASATNSKSSSLLRKSLIRSSISTVGTHDQDDESSAYHFSIAPIQQAVGNRSTQTTKSREESKKRPRNSMSMNSISSNTSSLNEINYIVPEILKESKLKQVNEAEQVDSSGTSTSEKCPPVEIGQQKQQDNNQTTQASCALNESQIEYVIIDPKKTPAIKSSSDLVSKQRNAERIKHLQNDQ